MAGVVLPAAALGFALALALSAAPEANPTAPEAEEAMLGHTSAAAVSSRALQEAASALAAIEERMAERSAEEASSQEVSGDVAAEAASPASEARAQAQHESAAKPREAPAVRTITVDGETVGYVVATDAAEAPASGAGLWKGSDSTTDGSFAYFIGHNPGSFATVARAGVGSSVSVVDSDGNARTYAVGDSFTVPRTTTWSEVSERVSGHGESVILQTCVEDGYKILVAW